MLVGGIKLSQNKPTPRGCDFSPTPGAARLTADKTRQVATVAFATVSLLLLGPRSRKGGFLPWSQQGRLVDLVPLSWWAAVARSELVQVVLVVHVRLGSWAHLACRTQTRFNFLYVIHAREKSGAQHLFLINY